MKLLFSRMQEIVDKYCIAYKTDLDLDKKLLRKNPELTYLWIVRECGTYLLPLAQVNLKDTYPNTIANYYLEQKDFKKLYIVSAKHLKETSYKECCKMLNEAKQIKQVVVTVTSKTIKEMQVIVKNTNYQLHQSNKKQAQKTIYLDTEEKFSESKIYDKVELELNNLNIAGKKVNLDNLEFNYNYIA